MSTPTRTIVVTGGAGFIGANLCRWWRRNHPADTVHVVDCMTYAADPARLEGVVDEVLEADIGSAACARALRQWQPDVVVNCAAETHVDRSLADPGPFLQSNVVAFAALLQAVLAARTRDGAPVWLHQVSTDEVFGDRAGMAAPATRDDAYRPSSPYAASKAAADHLLAAWQRSHGLQGSLSWCTNNYGPGQYPEKLIPLAIRRMLAGEPVPLYGDGEQERDWLFVDDHCRGIAQVVGSPVAGARHAFASGTQTSNRTLLRLLGEALDARFTDADLRQRFPACPAASGGHCADLVTPVADRPGHDRRYALAVTPDIPGGWTAQTGLAEGLRATVDDAIAAST